MSEYLIDRYEAFKERFGAAGVVLGVIAIVLAVGGSAFAASGLNGKQKKEVKSIAKSFAGKPGAPGAPGTAGTNGTNGKDGAPGAPGEKGKDGTNGTNGAPGTSVTNTAVPTSSATCNHLGGAEFKVGAGAATTACNGQTGFTDTLPSGQTETGTWGLSLYNVPKEGQNILLTPISFTIPLTAGSEESFILNAEETEEEAGTGGCTGTLENPTAPAGVLCIYTWVEANENITNPFTVFAGTPGYSPSGTVIVFSVEAAPARILMAGSWAVTAP